MPQELWGEGAETWSQVVFALLHNFYQKGEDEGFKFSWKHVPLPQYVWGKHLWEVMASQGFWSAVWRHMMVNSLAVSLLWVRRQSRREEEG